MIFYRWFLYPGRNGSMGDLTKIKTWILITRETIPLFIRYFQILDLRTLTVFPFFITCQIRLGRYLSFCTLFWLFRSFVSRIINAVGSLKIARLKVDNPPLEIVYCRDVVGVESVVYPGIVSAESLGDSGFGMQSRSHDAPRHQYLYRRQWTSVRTSLISWIW